jgi:CubicO group peptidase (beta-lactamase class C family)
MRAIEQASLSLDAEINPLLPFVVDSPRFDGETIRLRHLATHTAGILDHWDVLGPLYVDGDSPIALGDLREGYFVAGGEWYDATANFTSPTAPPGIELPTEGRRRSA